MGQTPTDEITARQAADLLGLKAVSSISRYVKAGTLTPSRQLPGDTGAFLFWRADIIRLAEKQRADRAKRDGEAVA